ncbi:MAG TPA: hypothetical protein PLP23_05155 [Panacibacter sp.]|nr:hypothetical protein [Panacibacter sp.]
MNSKYFTPFADEAAMETATEQNEAAAQYNNEQYAAYTPFSNEFEKVDTTQSEFEADEKEQQYYEILDELYDREFETAVYNMVNEMRENFMSYEAENPFVNEAQTAQLASQYLQPVLNEANNLFNEMATVLETMPIQQMSETELEAALDNIYSQRESNLTPAQEFFIKKLHNKGKAAAKATAKKKGGGKILKKVFEKLGPIVKPLIEKVLNLALNKLPPDVRKIAKEFAKKLFNRKKTQRDNTDRADATDDTDDISYSNKNDDDADDNDEQTDNSEEGNENDDSYTGEDGETPTTYPVQNIQAEFDYYITRYIQTDNETLQQNLLNEYENNVEKEAIETNALHEAKEQFIQELENLKEGEDPAPALENFIAEAIKAAQKIAKIAIKIIGRDKVVAFLANLMAKWISKYIAPDKALKLATVMADKGLKLLKLETGEPKNARAVYEAIAHTVEEAATKITALPDAVLNNPEVLAQEAYMAFENAAAAYFPDNVIRYEARESETGDGHWQSKGNYYKHTKTFETALDVNKLKSIETFGGVSLYDFITDTLRIQSPKPVDVKIHLFQASRGATLSAIAKNETKIPGLGSASPSSYMQLHPLTIQAATALLGQPRLGKNVRPVNKRNRNLIFQGERFYYLQITGGAAVEPGKTPDSIELCKHKRHPHHIVPVPIDPTPVAQSSQIQTFITGSLRDGIHVRSLIYISEDNSLKILAAMKQQSWGELYEYFKKLQPGFERNWFGGQHKIGGIIMKGMLEIIGKIVKEKLPQQIMEKIKHHIEEFEKAVNDPRNGVTVVVSFGISLHKEKLAIKLKNSFESMQLHVLPGYIQKSKPHVPHCPRCTSKKFPIVGYGVPANAATMKVQKPSFN